ncbi:hypothetical protein D9M68_986240 [compost metagenome]
MLIAFVHDRCDQFDGTEVVVVSAITSEDFHAKVFGDKAVGNVLSRRFGVLQGEVAFALG